MTERRQDRRLPAAAVAISGATMRPGRAVTVVDACPGGVQIESDRPMRPGSQVHLRLVTDDATLQVAAHVLRCQVWGLHPDAGVTYRGALRFEDRCSSLAAGPGGLAAAHNNDIEVVA